MRAQDYQIAVLFLRHLNDGVRSLAVCHQPFHLNRCVFGDLFIQSVKNVGVGHFRLWGHQAELSLNGFLRLLDIKQDQPCIVSTRQGIGSMKRIVCQVGKIRCVSRLS